MSYFQIQTPEYNPGCTGQAVCSFNESQPLYSNNVFMVKSSSKVDNLFFVWSSIGTPSLTLIRTDPEAELDIDWDQFEDGMMDGPELTVNNGSIYSASGYILSKVSLLTNW